MSRNPIDYPPIDKPKVLDDIIYAAAFYECEGYCGHVQNQFTIRIGQNDREKLDWIQNRFGGNVYGPYPNAKRNETFVLTIVRARAVGFMFTIFSYLSKSRREQFKLALKGEKSSRTYTKANSIPKDIKKILNLRFKRNHGY